MSEPFDPYYSWLGISPKQRPIDYYALLGIQRFESDSVILESAADQRMSHVRAFQTGPRGELAARILNELAAARIVLLNHDKKAAYDEHLRSAGSKGAQSEPTASANEPSPEAPASGPSNEVVAGKRTYSLAVIGGGGIAVAAIAALVIVLANQGDNRPISNEKPANNDQRPAVTEAKAGNAGSRSANAATRPPSAETVAASSPSPTAAAQSDEVDLLALVDLKRDTKQGRVLRQGNGLLFVENKDTSVALPYQLPPEYQIEMTVTRMSGNHVLGLVLALAGRRFDFRIDATPQKRTFTGIGQLDGKSTADSPQSHRGLVLSRGVTRQLTLVVGSNSVRFFVDGSMTYHWEGDPKSLSATEPKLFDFGLFAFWSSFEIQSMTIRPLNGAADEASAVAAALKTTKPAPDSAAAEPVAPKQSDAPPDRDSKPVDSTVASPGVPRTDAKVSTIESPKVSDLGTTATPDSTHIDGTADVTNPAAAAALAVFKDDCYRCHGRDGSNEGGLNFILQTDKLIANKYIIAGDPSGSRLFKRVSEGSMPPQDEQPRPSADQTAALKRWIEAGAPRMMPAPVKRKWIANSDIVKSVYDDVERQQADDRRFLRYFTLTHLYNAGLSDDELQTYRLGLSKLVNSLSWGDKIVVPQPIDPIQTILRIDLRDFEWTEKTWDAIVAENPYSIVTDGRQFRDLTHLTRTELPFVRGDWFVAAASVPPLYHRVLEIPETLADLERLLRISVADDIHQLRIARAGFNKSGISRNNRLIERHATHFGAYWQSYDFGHSDGRANLFSHPLGPDSGPNSFRHDGGEIIFNLPNGLQAYMIVDGAGDRLDNAPLTIVSDPRRPDRAVANGLSCMSCHIGGIHEKADEVREAVHANLKSFSADEAREVAAIYLPPAKMREMQVQDAERFQAALKLTGALPSRTEPVLMLVQRFEAPLDLTTAAAEVGIQPESLLKLLDRAPQSSRTLAALRSPGGTIQRQVLVDALDTLTNELNLGRAHSLATAAAPNTTPSSTVVAKAERPTGRTPKSSGTGSGNGKRSRPSSNDLAPLVKIRLAAEIPDVILGKDRRWLYLLNASEGTVQRVDTQTLKLDQTEVKAVPGAERMRLTPNGRTLYICGSPKGHNSQQESPGTFQVIPTEKFETSTRFTVPFDPWDFAPDDRGRLFVTSGSAQSVPVRLVDANKQAVIADVFLNWNQSAIRLSNDGKTLCADNLQEINVFSLAGLTGKGSDQRLEPAAAFESGGPFEFSGDDRFLITNGGPVGRLGSARDGKIPRAANLDPSLAIATDRQSKLVFFSTEDRQLKIYSTPNFELQRSLNLGARVSAMAVDAVGGRLFAALRKDIRREGRGEDAANVSDLAIYDISGVVSDGATLKKLNTTSDTIQPEKRGEGSHSRLAAVPRIESTPNKSDATSNDLKPVVTFKLGATITNLVLGKDRRFVYFLDSSEGLIRRIDTQTVQIDDTAIETGPGAQRLGASPNGKTLYAITAPEGHPADTNRLTGQVIVIPTQQFQVSNRFTIPFDPSDLAPDNQGRLYVRPGKLPGKIQLVDASKQAVISQSAGFWERGSVTLSRDEKLLIVGGLHGASVFSTSQLQPTTEGSNLIKPIGVFEDSNGASMQLGRAELSPDGKFLALEHGEVGRIGNNRDRNIPEAAKIDPWDAIAFDPSISRVLISTRDKQLKVYSLPTFELVRAFNLGSRVHEMALDAAGGKLYAAITNDRDRRPGNANVGDVAVFDVGALVGKVDNASPDEQDSGSERSAAPTTNLSSPEPQSATSVIGRDLATLNELRPEKLFKLQAVIPGLALSRDRQQLLILNSTEGQLLRLDTITLALDSDPIKLAPGADTMAVSPTGNSIFVGASPQGHPKPQFNEPARPGTIQVIDAQTFKSSTFAIPFTPSHLVADSKGLLVSDLQGWMSTLHLIDTHRQVQVD